MRKGQKMTEAGKANVSASLRGRTRSAEDKTKISVTMKSRWSDPEVREHHSRKMREAWARKRAMRLQEVVSAPFSPQR